MSRRAGPQVAAGRVGALLTQVQTGVRLLGECFGQALPPQSGRGLRGLCLGPAWHGSLAVQVAGVGAECAPRPESSSGHAAKSDLSVWHLGLRWPLWSQSHSGTFQAFRAGDQPGSQIPTQLSTWQPRGLLLTFPELVSGVRAPVGGGREAGSVAIEAPGPFQKYLSKIKLRRGGAQGMGRKKEED